MDPKEITRPFDPRGKAANGLFHRLIRDAKERFVQTEAYAREDGRVVGYTLFDAAWDAIQGSTVLLDDIFAVVTAQTNVPIEETEINQTIFTSEKDRKERSAALIIDEEIARRDPHLADMDVQRGIDWQKENLVI